MGNFCLLFKDRLGAGALQVGAYEIAGHPTDGQLNLAPIRLSWKAGASYGVGTTASVTLTDADGVPAIDLYDHSTEYRTPYPGGWSGTITLGYEETIHQVILDTPTANQAYPSGTSIIPSATVVEPDIALTNTVTFHMTPISPAGATVDIVSTSTNSPFTADFGILPNGTYTMNATTINNGSPAGTATSATRTFTVVGATTTTTSLASSANPSTYGQSVTFTATVSPIPTGGTVQFYDAGSPLGSPVSVNTGTGEASYSIVTLGAGSHAMTATYSGVGVYLGSTSAAVSQVVDKAPLTVQALNTLRAPNTANPDPLPYRIAGYQNGQSLATSGVTGAPALTTTAILSSPVGDYPITAALGSLAASNYSFTFVNGTLTVAVVANTFSVNFWAPRGYFTAEQAANMLVPSGVPAGKSDWFTSGWLNFNVPFGVGTLPAVALTSNQGSAATFNFNDARNGGPYSGVPRTTFLGDGNYTMMDGHVNSTLEGTGNKFDMQMTNIPFATYDVIFYMGANLDQFGNGEGVIVFNGGAERNFKLESGAFDGTFTEMVDATTEGNYIVFKNVTGSSFTTQTWGLGPNDFNHVGPFGFQIKEVTASGYTAWQTANATSQTMNQDLDLDGVANGIEYFISGPVATSGFTPLPSVVNTAGTLSSTWTKAGSYTGVYGTDFHVETSATLDAGTWTPDPLATVLTSGNNVTSTFPAPLVTKKFARLRVTGP